MRRSSISSSRPGAVFRRILGAGAACFLAAMAASGFLLWRTGETNLTGTVKAQIETQGIANLLSVPFYRYKRAMYVENRPETTVMGSSRALQFRAYMFRASFYGLGGGSKDIDAAFAVADDLLLSARPKLVIQALDIWQFWGDRDVAVEHPQRPHALVPAAAASINPLMLPAMLVLQGRLNWRDLRNIVAGKSSWPLPMFGLYAKLSGRGFSADGSEFPEEALETELLLPASDRFSAVLSEIGRPKTALLPGPSEALDLLQISLLRQFVDELGARGITVVPVLVPLPPAVLAAVKGNAAYGYIERARAELRRQVPETIDLLDPAGIGSGDCEFLDGLHGGEITYARVALAIAQAKPDVAGFFAVERLREVIQKYAGFAVAPVDRVGQVYSDRILAYQKNTACRDRPLGAATE